MDTTGRLVLLAVAIAGLGCAWMRGDPPKASPAAPATTGVTATPAAPVPPATPAPPTAVAFDAELRPLLQQRCGKCHFPGGKMHARLPFDDEATVRQLGPEKLRTRIEDDEGRRILRAYFGAPSP